MIETSRSRHIQVEAVAESNQTMQARPFPTFSLATLLLALAGLAVVQNLQNVELGLTNADQDTLARVGIEGEDIPLPVG